MNCYFCFIQPGGLGYLAPDAEIVLRAGPDFAAPVRKMNGAIHWLHGCMSQIGYPIAGVNHAGSALQRPRRVPDSNVFIVLTGFKRGIILCKDVGTGALIVFGTGEVRGQLLQSLAGAPVIVGDNSNGIFQFYHTDHTAALHDGINIVHSLQLATEYRRCGNRGIKHALWSGVDPELGAAIHFGWDIHAWQGSAHQRELLGAFEYRTARRFVGGSQRRHFSKGRGTV